MAVFGKKKNVNDHIHTLEEYIKNPEGKGNSTVPAIVRESIMNDYKTRFSNLMLRENGKVKYYLYKNNTDNVYYSLVKVPSESIHDFYYDVVFKFSATEDTPDAGRNLAKYNIQFFSNDPAFVYTYAYVFEKNGLFIDELKSKMSSEALKYEPKERNPKQVINYVKSIVFAYLVLSERGLLTKATYGSAETYNPNLLLDQIEHADQKIRERQEEDKEISHRKKLKIDTDLQKKLSRYNVNLSKKGASRIALVSKKAGKVKKTSAINSTKRTKKI